MITGHEHKKPVMYMKICKEHEKLDIKDVILVVPFLMTQTSNNPGEVEHAMPATKMTARALQLALVLHSITITDKIENNYQIFINSDL